jgi:hypothetical protein
VTGAEPIGGAVVADGMSDRSTPTRAERGERVNEHVTATEEWVPHVLVRRYRGGHLIEQRTCESPEAVADLVETWEAEPSPKGETIAVEPHPPEVIVGLLRAIADAVESGQPVPMRRPFPHVRLQLVTEGSERGVPGQGELKLLWQELAHPGD